jgi:translation initiation factor 3 subunit L
MITKLFDKTMALVCVCMCLCPGFRVDDQVRALATDKYADKCRRLEIGDVSVYEDMVSSACPKFISASPPDDGAPTNAGQVYTR